MMRQTSVRRWAGGMLVGALLALLAGGSRCAAAGPSEPGQSPRAPATGDRAPGIPRPGDRRFMLDPQDRITGAQIQLLNQAVDNLDASLLADVGLELANEEKVLMRDATPISAAEVLDLAVRVATENRDTKTLDRLARAAKNLDRKELASKVESARKLANAGRGEETALSVPVDETTTEQFAQYQRLARDIQRAVLTGESKRLDTIREEVGSASGLTKRQQEALEQQIKSARESMPQSPDEAVVRTLDRLQAASRDDVAFSEWQSRYTTPGGTINADLVLQGDSGTYTLDDGSTGTLYNLRYSRLPGGVILIQGRWSFQGEGGSVQWRVPPIGTQILGQYQSDSGQRGAWNGSRADGGGGGGDNGSPVPFRPRRHR